MTYYTKVLQPGSYSYSPPVSAQAGKAAPKRLTNDLTNDEAAAILRAIRVVKVGLRQVNDDAENVLRAFRLRKKANRKGR
jgi:hypothetical protein